MSNIGEAQITRLTRERLAAIKKFLPVRDSFRDNLQAQQQARMGFTDDTKRLFEPITTVTETVGKKTQKYLKTLPKDIVEAQLANIPVIPPPPPPAAVIPPPPPPPAAVIPPPPPAAVIPPPPPAAVIPPKTKKKFVSFIEKFTDKAIGDIRSRRLRTPDDFEDYGALVAESYPNRGDVLKAEYNKDVKKDDFVDWVYKINRAFTSKKDDDGNYIYYKAGVDRYNIQQERKKEKLKQQTAEKLEKLRQELKEEKEQLRQQTTPAQGQPDPDLPEEEITGQGYNKSKNFHRKSKNFHRN